MNFGDFNDGGTASANDFLVGYAQGGAAGSDRRWKFEDVFSGPFQMGIGMTTVSPNTTGGPDGTDRLSVTDPAIGTSYFSVASYGTGTPGNSNVCLSVNNYNGDFFGDGLDIIYSGGSRSAPAHLATETSMGLVNFKTWLTGTTYGSCAGVEAYTDGVHTATSVPGRLIFNTTPTGAIDAIERARIDKNGAIITGGVAAQANTFGVDSALQLNITNAGGVIATSWNAANSVAMFFQRSRGAAAGTHTAVASGDGIGGLVWGGSDGTAFAEAADIVGTVDGAVAANKVPGRLGFFTNPVGGTAAVERLRIDNAGNVVVNTAAIATTATDGFLYVPTCAGPPTGIPTTYTGRAPIVIDTTNNKLYFYSTGAWRDAGP